MTEPARASQPAPADAPRAEVINIAVPDEARMEAEIENDRHHELFLVRAALVATILVSVVIAARLVWQ